VIRAAIAAAILVACGAERAPAPRRERGAPPATTAPSSKTRPHGDAGPPPAPPPVAIEVPSEFALPVGRAARNDALALEISLLAAETVAGHPRARVRILLGPGDHEVDLVADGPPVDVDGVRVRFVRMNHAGPILSVDRGARGWSPREE
jgi:hypothetical protein